MNTPIGFAIVKIVGPQAVTAFTPFLRALRQENIQVHALAKNGRENTLQRPWRREHSANEQVSGDAQHSQTGSVHQGEKELIMMALFDLKSIRQEDAAILNTILFPLPLKQQFRLQYHFSSASLWASQAPGHS